MLLCGFLRSKKRRDEAELGSFPGERPIRRSSDKNLMVIPQFFQYMSKKESHAQKTTVDQPCSSI